jgi:hypothetical protein
MKVTYQKTLIPGRLKYMKFYVEQDTEILKEADILDTVV